MKYMNLAVDLLEKLDASGFPVKEVCDRAGVSPSTLTIIRKNASTCSQKVYDKMIVAIIEMNRERIQKMRDAGLEPCE